MNAAIKNKDNAANPHECLSISDLRPNQFYRCRTLSGAGQSDNFVMVRCLGNYGAGKKVYLTRAESKETPETLVNKMRNNIKPDCFVCWDHEISSRYQILPF